MRPKVHTITPRETNWESGIHCRAELQMESAFCAGLWKRGKNSFSGAQESEWERGSQKVCNTKNEV